MFGKKPEHIIHHKASVPENDFEREELKIYMRSLKEGKCPLCNREINLDNQLSPGHFGYRTDIQDGVTLHRVPIKTACDSCTELHRSFE